MFFNIILVGKYSLQFRWSSNYGKTFFKQSKVSVPWIKILKNGKEAEKNFKASQLIPLSL